MCSLSPTDNEKFWHQQICNITGQRDIDKVPFSWRWQSKKLTKNANGGKSVYCLGHTQTPSFGHKTHTRTPQKFTSFSSFISTWNVAYEKILQSYIFPLKNHTFSFFNFLVEKKSSFGLVFVSLGLGSVKECMNIHVLKSNTLKIVRGSMTTTTTATT